jgi:hypothetical protein
MSDNQFAYGESEVEINEDETCECPSTAAGFETEEKFLNRVAGLYDEKLFDEDEYHGCSGVVSEEEAKAAWLEVLTHFKSQDQDQYAEKAEKVACELGWIGDE